MEAKVYVAVTARFGTDGKLRPLDITWEDGRVYEIDRILDVRQAASLKVASAGLRYTCRIQGKATYLFYERDRWFVERRVTTPSRTLH